MRGVCLTLAGALVLGIFACSSDETQTEPTTTSTSSSGIGGAGGTGGSSSGTGGSSSGTGGGGGSGGSAGGGGSSSGGGGGSAGGGGSSSGGGSGGGGGSSSSGGGGGDAMTATLTNDTFYINCQPMVPPDPIIGGFTASYDNSNGTSPAQATVTKATLTMTANNQTLVWSFTVNPTGSGTVAAGATTQQVHQKVSNSGTGVGPGAPCGYCSGTWVLDVTWQIGGQSVSDSLSLGGVFCVS